MSQYSFSYQPQDQYWSYKGHLLVTGIVALFLHYHGFKQRTFTHHKLYHPMNKGQQPSVGGETVSDRVLSPNSQ